MSHPNRSHALVALVAILFATVGAAPVGARQAGEDTLSLIEPGGDPTNIDVAVTIARETFEESDTVLISRDDRFADALSSGLLQSDAPLLMVPTDGPVPPTVSDQIADLGATRAIILGGVAAVSEAVEDELTAGGLAVERRQGDSRFETAIDVASTDGAEATTVMLARAFPAPGGPESQGFADTLAAGGVSAREGYPILLTETRALTGATRQYLDSAPIERVLVMGGTAAISDAVTAELTRMGIVVERVAGDTRDETAVEIAKISGDDSAADAERVIVTEGEGEDAWARGFALASHAAAFDAPIVLTLTDRIPESTEAFLSGGIGGDQTQTVLTCAVESSLCEETRVAAQLPPEDTEEFSDIGPVEVELDVDDVNRIEFDALAGERIGFGYGTFLADSPDEVVCVELRLLGPDGETIASFNGFPLDCTNQRTGNGSTNSVVIEQGGTHVLETTMDGAASLELFATRASDVTSGPDADPIRIAQNRPGEVHRMIFEGAQGDQVGFGYRDLLPEQIGGNACVSMQLLSPSDNTRVARLDNAFVNCSQQHPSDGLSDVAVLPFDGTYVLETALLAEDAGSVELYLTSAQTLDVTLGSPTPVELMRPGALHRGFFEGTAGQTVTLSFDDVISTDPQGKVCAEVELINPAGTTESRLGKGFTDCSDRDAMAQGDQLTLPTTGTYILETSIREGRSGTVSVQVE